VQAVRSTATWGGGWLKAPKLRLSFLILNYNVKN
jgi:hypothetical protein